MALSVSQINIGPMIGHTTPTGFRLWGRGPGEKAAGVARVFNEETGELVSEHVFSFVEYFDFVGLVDVGILENSTLGIEPLQPGMRYRFEVGCVEGFFADELTTRLNQGETLDWNDLSGDDHKGSVRTFPRQGTGGTETRFILGSCRDPKGEAGELTFKSIDRQITNGGEPRPDFILMTGDQIYIDRPPKSLREHKIPTSIKDYWASYRSAFGMPNFASVMRRLPAYMMLDDHEILNNWTGARFREEEGKYLPELLKYGQTAFEAYQACLGKNVPSSDTFGPSAFPGEGMDKKYWFDFNHGEADFFMADVRTGNERHKGIRKEPNALSDDQFNALTAWLDQGHGRIKFIISAVPAFPDTRLAFGSPKDKWGGAVQQRHRLLEFIKDKKIPKVVFLSGDVHVSFVSELIHSQEADFKVHQIVSSAFYWKPPGLQGVNFGFGPLKRKNEKGERPSQAYVSKRLRTESGRPKVHKDDNFTRITAKKEAVKVEIFGGFNGALLETVDIRF